MATIFPRSRGRAAFTLIELLVVIAIIAIIAALILAGVMSVYVKGYEAQNRADILNISAALQRFYADKKFYPPDQLLLHKNYADYAADPRTQLAEQSVAYIAAMWPNLGNFVNIHWAGTYSDGVTPIPIPAGANGGFVLEGDQVLVFLLAGPPKSPLAAGTALPMPAADCNTEGKAALLGGFVKNPTDPIYLGPYSNTRKQLDRSVKYIDFDQGRLFYRNPASPFPSYRDAYPSQGPSRPPSPFVYFSSNKTTNGYIEINLSKGSGAPNSIGSGIYPYKDSAGNFYNKTTFQLISAGLDGQFGTGGIWPPVSGKVNVDDFSNFSDKQLGSN